MSKIPKVSQATAVRENFTVILVMDVIAAMARRDAEDSQVV